MTTAYKVLAQSLPSTNSITVVYTVPTGNSAVLSTVSVCNTSNINNARYRLTVQKSGTTFESNTFIVYDAAVATNDTAFLTLGLTLGANDSLRANITSGNANVVISIFGSEVY